jgi:hypothetical protein
VSGSPAVFLAASAGSGCCNLMHRLRLFSSPHAAGLALTRRSTSSFAACLSLVLSVVEMSDDVNELIQGFLL